MLVNIDRQDRKDIRGPPVDQPDMIAAADQQCQQKETHPNRPQHIHSLQADEEVVKSLSLLSVQLIIQQVHPQIPINQEIYVSSVIISYTVSQLLSDVF